MKPTVTPQPLAGWAGEGWWEAVSEIRILQEKTQQIIRPTDLPNKTGGHVTPRGCGTDLILITEKLLQVLTKSQLSKDQLLDKLVSQDEASGCQRNSSHARRGGKCQCSGRYGTRLRHP